MHESWTGESPPHYFIWLAWRCVFCNTQVNQPRVNSKDRVPCSHMQEKYPTNYIVILFHFAGVSPLFSNYIRDPLGWGNERDRGNGMKRWEGGIRWKLLVYIITRKGRLGYEYWRGRRIDIFSYPLISLRRFQTIRRKRLRNDNNYWQKSLIYSNGLYFPSSSPLSLTHQNPFFGEQARYPAILSTQ